MKRTVTKTENGHGDKCKTYLYDMGDMLIFRNFTLTKRKHPIMFVGDEEVVRKGNGYIMIYHWFGIKKSTLNELLK